MFCNPYRGDLTVQSHTREDVLAQLLVGDRATTQTSDCELDLVAPLPASALVGLSANEVAVAVLAHHRQQYPDYDLGQEVEHTRLKQLDMHPLNVDVAQNRVLSVQYHDRARRANPEAATGLVNAENLDAYELTVYLEYEEIITP